MFIPGKDPVLSYHYAENVNATASVYFHYYFPPQFKIIVYGMQRLVHACGLSYIIKQADDLHPCQHPKTPSAALVLLNLVMNERTLRLSVL